MDWAFFGKMKKKKKSVNGLGFFSVNGLGYNFCGIFEEKKLSFGFRVKRREKAVKYV